MAWVSEGAATYLAGQVPHMRARRGAAAARGRPRPSFPPAARDALVLGGTVFDFLAARGGGQAAADALALSRTPEQAMAALGATSRAQLGGLPGGVRRRLTGAVVQDLQQRGHHALVELGAGAGQQLGARLGVAHGRPVGAVGGHGVVGVAGQHDP